MENSLSWCRFSRNVCCDLLVMSACVQTGEEKHHIKSLAFIQKWSIQPTFCYGVAAAIFPQGKHVIHSLGAGLPPTLHRLLKDVSPQHLGVPFSCQLMGGVCTREYKPTYTREGEGEKSCAHPFLYLNPPTLSSLSQDCI